MTNDQEALLKKARKSLAAAKVLLNDDFHEAAISRAYYTMFYLASALLHNKGLSFTKHGSMLGAFGLHFIKSGEIEQKFHRYLIDSFDLRHIADYDINITLDQTRAEEQIAHAEEFLTMAGTLLNT